MNCPDKQEPIAIVGAACRFPGEASSLGSLWDMISKVKTGHCPVPKDRWDSERWYHPNPDRKGGIVPRHGYFIKQDISQFDAPFFSMTAKEAAAMDPMKRLLLEVSYESFENAGISVSVLMNSRTGCYVGCMTNDYETISLLDTYDISNSAALGVSEAMTANRISWFYGLKGPSLTIDTACSSSMYALHYACQSLRLKETNMSLVAGVNLIIDPKGSHVLTNMHMLSPDGISHTFDDRANGYGRGDGVASLVLKRLCDAIRDGDTIRAVIRGTGVNADGKTPSVTQPSAKAQAHLINQTYEDAGLDQSDTGYFECHGTGTPVGDPLELTAIATTIGAARRSAGKSPLPIGSIKPTVGHTEGCAGLAGVFKAILLLEKGMLVPTYGVQSVNPKLKLDDWHLTLPQSLVKWPTTELRRASVNSFGFGGANAHAILDDAYHYCQQRGLVGDHNTTIPRPDLAERTDDGQETDVTIGAFKQLFLFTGKDKSGAQRVADRLNTWLQNEAMENNTKNLAYTLAMRRTHLEHRAFTVARSRSELTERLAKGLPAAIRSQRYGNNLVMIFTGQGAQWAGMGRELLEIPAFRRSIETSQSYLKALGCRWDATEELTNTNNTKINLPEYSQPLCTVVQIALVDILRSWKILPTATIGHSSGEIAAAYAAALLSQHDAVKLAYFRGLSSSAVSRKGATMAVGLAQDEAQKYLENVPPGSAVVACLNSPSSVTLSGDVEAIDQLEILISRDGKFARKLEVVTAYHSPHMKEVSGTYLQSIGDIVPLQRHTVGDATVMYSSLTGCIISSAEELNAQYWVDNMQNPVQFSQALLALLKHRKANPDSHRQVLVQWGGLLEVGPHAALQGPLRQTIDTGSNQFAKSAPYISMLFRGKDASETSLTAAGVLWSAGYNVDLNAVNNFAASNRSTPRMISDLPSYPWSHKRSFWHESCTSRACRFPLHVRNDFLGIAEDAQISHEPRWRNYLRVPENPWIEHHTVTGTVLYPGSGMLVMALEGALLTADSSKTVKGFRMNDVMFARGMVISLDDSAPVETRLSFHPHSTKPGSFEFSIFSMTNGPPWVKHCTGTITLVYEQEASEIEEDGLDVVWQRQLTVWKALLHEAGSVSLNVNDFYKNLDTIGMQYGPTFRNTASLTAVPSKNASYGSVAIPDTKSTMPGNYESPHVIHPATMDSIFHLVIASHHAGGPLIQAVVPYSIDEIYVALDQPKEPGTLYSGYGRLLSHRGREITSELVVSDQEWSEPKLTIKNFGLRQVTSDKAGHVTTTTNKTNSKMIKNCANISWVPDLEFLADGGDLTKLILSGTEAYPMDTWLDAIFLKQANSTALIILFDESERNVEILVRLKTRTYGPSKIFAFATSQPGSEVMRAALGASSENLNISYDWLPTSQIFQKLAPEANDLVIALGVPDIANNAAILTRLSPLACLTYIKEPSEEDIVLSGRTCVSRLEEDKICFLFATRTSPDLTELPSSIVLLLPAQPSDNLSTLANMIQARLDGFGTSVTQSGLSASSIASLGGKSVISLLEIDSPLVYEWNEEQFSAFKDLVSTVRHLFWIARGSVLESWSGGVEFATSQGLFRVMRNEYPMAILPSLNLSAVAEICNAKYADLVLDVWRASLDEHGEMEYVEANGLIYVPRATENAGFDYELQLASNTASPTLAALDVSGEPLKASQSPDSRDCIWIPDDEANSPLGADEVEVNVECAGLGSGSTLDSVRHAVGIVTRRGDSVTAFELGQHVIVFSTAAARTHIRQNQAMVVSKPDYLEPHDAVALVEPVVTAQYALIELARLSQGQLCLFDNAGSAVGQALMQVAKAVGSDMFALVHNKAERDLIVDRFAIPTDHVFDSALNNFVPLIESAINQRGIDVFVSQHSGTHIAGAVSIMSAFGHFVDITTRSPRVSLPSASNITLTRVDVKAVVKGRKNVVSRLFQQAFTEYSLQGPSHMVAIPATNLPAVLNNVRAEQTVITLHDATPVLMPPPPARELELDGQATYVLVGGLGALGLEIAGWMVNCGAKHLVFLSRAGGSKNHDDLQRLSERFVQAEAYKCDVNDAASVARVFDTLKVGGKRIAGVVQLAMVLQDCIFENMSFRQWRNAISPKTEGSWNLLANISPGDKSFFILLSSITGVIGNKAQANYASGNTFEDALAHYARTHLGINATSIDVGLVSDSSHFTTAGAFGDLESYVRRYQHGWRGLQTNLTELGVVMRAIMRGSTTNGQEAPAQLVLGLGDGIKHNESMGGFSRDKKFQLRVVGKGDEAEGVDAKQDVGALLSNATTMLEATAVVEDNIKEMIAASMSIGIEEIDPQKPLFEYGGKSSLSLFENAFNISLTPVVDSLQAVEIRNRAQKFMRSDISVFDILSAMPLADVSAKISARSQLVKVTDSEE
ncbi:hypothetical protein HBI67_181380 [Parastagonospora nodorum]|nr:hypothetical protein HBI47_141020 [Parastagonospora nodorum]KAH6057689.1 hypothetical protein HBI67_181380 [Parastagonospora nodorum]KAH6066747.1 hypothetical protein HBI66_154450 [Parastagonospora nodorum]